MTTGLKVWLWIVLVLNAISCVGAVITALLVPLAWISVVLGLLVVAGAAMLLFARRKMGFYLICGANVLGLIVNLMLAANPVVSVIQAIVMPLIIWLLMKNIWYEFQ